MTGFIPEMLQLISGISNFTYDLSVEEDGIYGTQQPDGSWNGMIQKLISGVCLKYHY